MARLILQTAGLGRQAVELRLGINRVGRDRECEIQLPHPSVSWFHAELALTGDGVHLQDCHSTNGTFLNGQPCTEAWLEPGQQLRFGRVELLVESTDASVAIPQYDRTEPSRPAPVVRDDGRTVCPEHPENAATFRCLHCKEHMCNACVKLIRLRGRPPHFLCRVCSHPAERIEAMLPKKKGNFLNQWLDTVMLKFTHPRDRRE